MKSERRPLSVNGDVMKRGFSSDTVSLATLFTLSVILFLITLRTYVGALGNELVWDSANYIRFFEYRISSLALENLLWMLTSLEMWNWHPLTWLSWAIDYRLAGGINPAFFHRTNVMIHALNSVLVFWLMIMLHAIYAERQGRWFRDSGIIVMVSGFLMGLLFAVHPQHVESVVWVAQRKELLCMLMMLLSVGAYLHYGAGVTARKRAWYAGALGFYLLAALSKPMAVVLPLVLLLLDYFPLRRTVVSGERRTPLKTMGGLVAEKTPFILIAIGLAMVTLVAQQSAMAEVPFADRLLNAFNSYLSYLSKFLFPVVFSPKYAYFTTPGADFHIGQLFPLLGFLGITVCAVFLATRGRREWLTAWSVYVLSLLPVIGLVSVGFAGMADRYAYFPTLPFYFLIGGGIIRLGQTGRVRNWVAAAGAILLLSVWLGSKTSNQVKVWKSEITLWAHVVQISPADFMARLNLGIALTKAGAYPSALVHFDAAAALPYKKTRVYGWRVIPLTALGELEAALADHMRLEQAAREEAEVEVDWNCFSYNVGWLNTQLDRPLESGAWFERVAPESRWRSDADKWLYALKEHGASAAALHGSSDLPGFCPRLLPEFWKGSMNH